MIKLYLGYEVFIFVHNCPIFILYAYSALNYTGTMSLANGNAARKPCPF